MGTFTGTPYNHNLYCDKKTRFFWCLHVSLYQPPHSSVFVDPASQGTTCPVDGRGDQLDFAFRAGAGGDDFEAEAVSSGAISSAQCLTASLVIGFQEFTLFMALFHAAPSCF